MTVKRICFFTIGFAFNRLVRMKFYEKIFPKDVEIFLFTTDKYKGKEKESYQQNYEDSLKRTKIHYAHYNLLTLPFQLRKFCRENNIDRVMNVGSHFNAVSFLIATLFTKTDYFVNILSDMFNQYKLRETKRESFSQLIQILLTIPLIAFARKATFTDKFMYQRAPVVFLTSRMKAAHLAAPLNTSLFKIKDKALARKKLGLPKNKPIIIYVGRILYSRGSDFLKQLIKSHPEWYFIIIGRLMDDDFLKDPELIKLKDKNYQLISMKSSEELVDYYNAADFGLCVNREGAGPGLIAEESMACGTPIVISELFKLKESESLYQVPLKYLAVEKAILEYLSLPEKEKKQLRSLARKYIQENYSEDVWVKEYLKVYLDRYS